MGLGCGTYRAFIQPRGGAGALAELPWHSLSFGRRLDDVSAASVDVGVGAASADARCCAAFESLRAWEHELAIWRGDELAWVGVVGRPKFTAEAVSIPARDLFQWMERRVLPTDRSYTATDLGEIFGQFVVDALSRDTSPNIAVVGLRATGVVGSRQVRAAEYRRAADELRELARSGVDFTMVGRTLFVGGEEVPTDDLTVLTTEILDSVEIEVDGLGTATEAIVVGSHGTEQAEPIVGVYGGVDPYLGLVQTVDQEGSIADVTSARAAARTRWEMLHDPPEYVSGVLTPDAPVAFADLVPGAACDLRVQVGCRSAVGVWRLHSVDVRSGVFDSGAVDDAVAVRFIPLGTTEAA